MTLNFKKLVGAGNDFLFFEHDPSFTPERYSKLSQKLCHRNFGVGADGIAGFEVIDLNKAQFKWHFYNNDGSSAEMCGNAARCAVRYISQVYQLQKFELETLSGTVYGSNTGENVTTQWELKESNLEGKNILLKSGKKICGDFINTGVPHFVLLNPGNSLSLEEYSEIQKHPEFGSANTNVTTLDIVDGMNKTKSFERGVENFTLACGTGVIASAFVLQKQKPQDEYHLQAPGGNLVVKIENSQVTLMGPAQWVFQGSVEV